MSNELGIDRSGNNNTWTVNNMTLAADQMLDTPTNNFCTINPLDVQTVGQLKEGNLYANSGPARCRGTMAVSSGKWYYELLMVYQHHSTVDVGIRGVGGYKISVDTGNDFVRMQQPYNSGISINVGGSVTGDLNNGVVQGGSGDGAPGSIIGVMWDMDAETITFKSNNSALDSALTDIDFSGVNNMETVAPYFIINGGRTAVANFGQDSSFAGLKTAQGNQDGNDIGDFYYTPPTDYLALCTSNLPDVDVTPSEHFNTITYSGDSTNRTLTGVGFTPSFTWIKSRSNGTNGSDHWLFDAVRGVNAFKGLCSNGTSVEGEAAATSVQENFGDISAFTSDGYSVYRSTADSSHQYEGVNNSGETYVAWNWKANGSGSSNTNGSITSTVSANVDAGFSIVSYTGVGGEPKTVAHGLGVSPEMVIIKKRNNSGSWIVWHKDLADNYAFEGLDTTGAAISGGSPISKYVDAVSSTLVTLGDASENNNSGDTFIMYCWASVDGYSKVGSYNGNANADGAFIYTGFRPAFVIIKPSSRGGHWMMANNKSNPYNVVDKVILANTSEAEYTDPAADCKKDFLSNGFKIYTADDNTNDDETYIYIAFAEVPFKFANAR